MAPHDSCAASQSEPQPSSETLREALFLLRDSYDALKQTHSYQKHLLEGLETLLCISEEDDPFAVVFATLRKVFVFSHVFILTEVDGDDDLLCLVSEEPTILNTKWPVGALFRKIMAGKVTATFSGAGLDEWRVAANLGLSIERPVLYVPVRVRDRRGILILARNPGDPCFDRNDIAVAKKFSVVVSHALAARYANRDAAESRRLRELGEQLRLSEENAKRNANLLKQIVNALPVGVTVQNGDGGLTVINEFAERAFGKDGERLADLAGSAAADLRDSLAVTTAAHLSGKGQQTFEHEMEIGGETRVMLVNLSPAQICDDSLLITTSMDITERKRFEKELHHRACHDQLTGLPNRTLIKEMVGRRLSSSQERQPFALAFIDVDNFKQINDFYSHALGDQLLLAISDRIRNVIGAQDVLARISGDEFLLLIGVAHNEQAIQALIDRIADEIRKPFQLEGHEIFSSASFGVSIYPRHGHDYEALRRNADSAMYRAKSAHKGSVAFFDDSMRSALTARMEIEQKLRAAVRGGHFRVAYQSKNNIETGEVDGFEALVRWVDPDGTVYLPGLFVNIANELGLLGNITHVVLDNIAKDLIRFKKTFGDAVSVSLNVSAQQANSPEFMNNLLKRIERTGIGANLIIELTEEALVSARTFHNCVLPNLRQLGVRISIDDFGTGFSSLSMLSDIDADELKVDRAFITAIHERPRSQDILKAIESVCEALGIKIVAEGVESAQELNYISCNTNIRLIQGYIFGKPCFIEDVLCADAGIDARRFGT
jgi:diguanylate cyclase (GGDEF)-like protein/PAS domain S-box-containing protein